VRTFCQERFIREQKERDMMKLWAVLMILVSVVLVAPVVESGTYSSLNLFVAVGNADGGGGGE
jgi:ribosomal protein S5